MSARTLAFSSLLVLGACHTSIAEQDFPDTWAHSWCTRYADCDAADFESDYGDEASCESDQADDTNFADEWKDLLCGDYNESAAEDCINTMDSLQCDDWSNDEWKNECNRVYGC